MSRGTTRPLVAIAAVVGLAELGFATVIPLLPLYLKERLGASATLVGVVVAAFAAVETVCKTTWGHVADRIGRRPVVVGGLVLASAAPIVMTVLRVPWLFVPLRLVDGTGSAALWPATAAAIVDRTAANRRATGMGTLNMFFLSGLALGPSLGLFVSGAFGSYRAGFYLASGLLLAAAGLASLVLGDERAAPAETSGGTPVPGRGASAWRSVVGTVRASPQLSAMLAVSFVQMIGVGLLAPILVIYAHEVVGLSDQMIGAVFLVVVLAVAAGSIPGGRLADRVGRARTVVWGMTMASAGMWLLPAAGRGNLIVLGVAAALLGASYALSSPAWLALMSEAAPPGRTGMVMGASETAQGAGLILGPAFGGALYDRFGPPAPFLASALLLTAGTALAIRAVARRASARSDGRDRPGHDEGGGGDE
ncbi:MAG TPA: MFS transporter [bacterium]|nr:MFS transporter [bacterium]